MERWRSSQGGALGCRADCTLPWNCPITRSSSIARAGVLYCTGVATLVSHPAPQGTLRSGVLCRNGFGRWSCDRQSSLLRILDWGRLRGFFRINASKLLHELLYIQLATSRVQYTLWYQPFQPPYHRLPPPPPPPPSTTPSPTPSPHPFPCLPRHFSSHSLPFTSVSLTPPTFGPLHAV